jgi:hypothetical protein
LLQNVSDTYFYLVQYRQMLRYAASWPGEGEFLCLVGQSDSALLETTKPIKRRSRRFRSQRRARLSNGLVSMDVSIATQRRALSPFDDEGDEYPQLTSVSRRHP